MPLTGLEIYKLLPKTNCKECGFPTCLAFAMKLAAKQAELKQCPYVTEASQAKLYGTETAKFCVDRGMQIHGGYGYIGEFTIMEKLYRDQRLTEIYEGTSEIQRLVIAGHYLGGR